MNSIDQYELLIYCCLLLSRGKQVQQYKDNAKYVRRSQYQCVFFCLPVYASFLAFFFSLLDFLKFAGPHEAGPHGERTNENVKSGPIFQKCFVVLNQNPQK